MPTLKKGSAKGATSKKTAVKKSSANAGDIKLCFDPNKPAMPQYVCKTFDLREKDHETKMLEWMHSQNKKGYFNPERIAFQAIDFATSVQTTVGPAAAMGAFCNIIMFYTPTHLYRLAAHCAQLEAAEAIAELQTTEARAATLGLLKKIQVKKEKAAKAAAKKSK